jgi:cellulose synthase/poly-beta-1,6-N-acetylglucosamine synthase-like glycosyltransferase
LTVGPLVSIVVPVYITSAQQASLLAETLDTVDRQTCPSYEVILVDDGSPWDVGTLANRERVAIVRQANGGTAVARNTGIAASRGEFFIFLDGDDHLLPQAVECGVSHLRSNPQCGFAVDLDLYLRAPMAAGGSCGAPARRREAGEAGFACPPDARRVAHMTKARVTLQR